MRFRKSIKICKGIRVNVSKSGPSLTMGTKGASVSIGSKGTYLNTGIPGTGLYDRTKIGGTSQKTQSKNYVSQNNNMSIPIEDIKIIYADDGTIQLADASNNLIFDQALIRKIKQTHEYKMELERLNQERMNTYNHEIYKMVHIQNQTISVLNTEQYHKQLMQLQPQQYIIKNYTIPMPTMAEVESDLYKEAKLTIKTKQFWKKSNLEKRYVEETKQIEYNRRLSAWNSNKESFYIHEQQTAATMNNQYLLDYEKKKLNMQKLLACDEETTAHMIEQWLANITFPFEFKVQFEQHNSRLYLDLDLPEIENMLQKKAQKMANGTVKIKNKTQKEIKADYSECVFGLALFFASHLFNIAIGISEIIISGYTQRRNKKGDLVDDYIYSVLFTREGFGNFNINLTARENCMHFENRCLQNADLNFKSIEPYKF